VSVCTYVITPACTYGVWNAFVQLQQNTYKERTIKESIIKVNVTIRCQVAFMCVKGQGHNSRSNVLVTNRVSTTVSSTPWMTVFGTKDHPTRRWLYRIHDQGTGVKGQCHNSMSDVLFSNSMSAPQLLRLLKELWNASAQMFNPTRGWAEDEQTWSSYVCQRSR